MEPFYPLRVFICENCFLVQLEEHVSPNEIFRDYAYYSSYSDSWLQHAKGYTKQMIERFGLGQQSQVVEIASNDGYLLQYFVALRVPALGIEPAAILITHGHSDHIAGNTALKRHWPGCPIVIGEVESPKLTDPMLNLSALFGLPMTSPPAEVTVKEGDIYEAAGFRLKVLEIPGHTTGHVVYKIEDCEPPVVFVGDVIFAGSVGRTDFPDGDFKQLARGIQEKLFVLPEETLLYPGHGSETTVGKEKRTNPFVGNRQ
jgi:hypothetical protein